MILNKLCFQSPTFCCVRARSRGANAELAPSRFTRNLCKMSTLSYLTVPSRLQPQQIPPAIRPADYSTPQIRVDSSASEESLPRASSSSLSVSGVSVSSTGLTSRSPEIVFGLKEAVPERAAALEATAASASESIVVPAVVPAPVSTFTKSEVKSDLLPAVLASASSDTLHDTVTGPSSSSPKESAQIPPSPIIAPISAIEDDEGERLYLPLPTRYVFIWVNPRSGPRQGKILLENVEVQHYRLKSHPQAQIQLYDLTDPVDRKTGEDYLRWIWFHSPVFKELHQELHIWSAGGDGTFKAVIDICRGIGIDVTAPVVFFSAIPVGVGEEGWILKQI